MATYSYNIRERSINVQSVRKPFQFWASRRRMMSDGRWAMGDRRWAMGGGRGAMGDGRWAGGDGRWAMGDVLSLRRPSPV